MNNKYGIIHIKLDKITQHKNMSKNAVMKKAEMQRTQLNHYYRNEINRIDINVLARLCYTLNCNIEDILEYIPPEYKSK